MTTSLASGSIAPDTTTQTPLEPGRFARPERRVAGFSVPLLDTVDPGLPVKDRARVHGRIVKTLLQAHEGQKQQKTVPLEAAQAYLELIRILAAQKAPVMWWETTPGKDIHKRTLRAWHQSAIGALFEKRQPATLAPIIHEMVLLYGRNGYFDINAPINSSEDSRPIEFALMRGHTPHVAALLELGAHLKDPTYLRWRYGELPPSDALLTEHGEFTGYLDKLIPQGALFRPQIDAALMHRIIEALGSKPADTAVATGTPGPRRRAGM